MGQPNAKEPKRRRTTPMQQGLNAPAAAGRPGVRPSAVSDAVLHPGSPQRHRDPNAMTDNSSSVMSAPSVGSPTTSTFPIVLRYVDGDVRALIAKKRPVYVAVETLNWQVLPMTPSTDSFYALLELPPGNHNYRFIVEGSEVVDSTQALAPSELSARPPTSTAGSVVEASTSAVPRPQPARDGKPANTVYLDDVLLATKEDDDVMDSGTGWGQDEIIFEESRKYPPIVPLHLRYTPLNTPPTLVRCAKDGRMAVVDSAAATASIVNSSDPNFTRLHPEHLPLPLSVTINHVYFQRREDHAVMGVTTRYCNKFTTVVYYTHLPSPAAGSSPAGAPMRA